MASGPARACLDPPRRVGHRVSGDLCWDVPPYTNRLLHWDYSRGYYYQGAKIPRFMVQIRTPEVEP